MHQQVKNTLHIDADMRKSVLSNRHQIAGIEKGLSHYLSGQADMTEVVYATNKRISLCFLVAYFRQTQQNFLENGRMEKLLAGLKKTFDYIIIDTPPLGSVIDAAIIAKQSDGSILVLQANSTSKVLAKSVKEQLKAANPNIIGAVLNKVENS